MALPFGLFVSLLNMVPYPQTVAVIPAVMLAGLRAVEGDSSFTVSVILALAVMGIVPLIQDSLITPHIVGQSVGLKPAAILLGVCVWGKLLGLLWLVLAMPLTCLGIACYRLFVPPLSSPSPALHPESAAHNPQSPAPPTNTSAFARTSW